MGTIFGPNCQVILESNSVYDGCIFDDCEIIGDMTKLRDIGFTRCDFRGRAGTWLADWMNASGGVLMTVDLRSGEVIPGPASDRDPSFPCHLRRN